jgi:hypothetical protein
MGAKLGLSHGMRVFKNRGLRKTFRPGKEEDIVENTAQ